MSVPTKPVVLFVWGKFAKRRLRSGIALKMDTVPQPGSGGVIGVYDSDGHDAVDAALANAVKKSVAQIDGTSARELKAPDWPRLRQGWEAERDRHDR